MNRKILLSAFLALAVAGAPLRAQEPDEKEKPKPQEPKKQPPPKPRPDQPRQEPAPPPQEPKPDKQREKQQKEQQKQQQKEQEKDQAKQQRRSSEQATKPGPQKGAQGKGQKIPQEKFQASFGREHTFRVTRRDDRRFHYSGYWFEVVEVWPAGWSFDDDCYIEAFGDDYYLVDVIHPEIRVLVIVVQG